MGDIGPDLYLDARKVIRLSFDKPFIKLNSCVQNLKKYLIHKHCIDISVDPSNDIAVCFVCTLYEGSLH